MLETLPVPTVDNVVRIFQSALTPVFLLTGTAGFLNVIATRLARVSDRVNALTDIVLAREEKSELRTQLSYLRKRTLALLCAVIFATAAGIFTCLATLGLFGGALGEAFTEQVLFWFFAGAVMSLLCALAMFLLEILVATRAMLRQIRRDQT